MEVANQSLENLIHGSKNRMSLGERVVVLVEMAGVMGYLHSLSPPVLHYDLKPSNVMMIQEGGKWIPKVSDVGLSMVMSNIDGNAQGPVSSPFYMAPEILLGESFTTKADVYSFGILCWEVLTLKKPYLDEISKFESYEDMVVAIAVDKYRMKIPLEIPAELREMIGCCWSTEPGERPSFEQIVGEKKFFAQFFWV
eukprot:TRINITY_DN9546_c0_g1_i1.p1 TRINITY_DN9546_c0_g1~~TRINITY_DN9546_c0_g1_i1.p1  ORF type:complete len:220 (-),score=64.21 TRINITY_DN9546_c0_g1_i1:35-622(-)